LAEKHLLNTAPNPLMDEHSQPTIYILAGPNGAGKTTFANSFLPTFGYSGFRAVAKPYQRIGCGSRDILV
jgi:tRNA A37 threonylcarbamoyladenosine biosynthesis protein TsaE